MDGFRLNKSVLKALYGRVFSTIDNGSQHSVLNCSLKGGLRPEKNQIYLIFGMVAHF